MSERRRPALPLLAVLLVGCSVNVPAPSAAGSAPPPTSQTAPMGTPAASAASVPASASARPSASAPAGATASAAATTSAGATASASAVAPAGFDLEVLGCNGGVVLDWTPLPVPAFHHYTALRSPTREIAPDWPPIAPAVDWGGTYITDPYVTSAVDASIVPSATRWSYRVAAYDAEDRVIAASPVRTTRMDAVDSLDRLLVRATDDGATRLRWAPFDGFSECFSAYRVLATPAGGTTLLIGVISKQAVAELETDALHPGTTYRLEIEAVRSATRGSFVVGRAGPVTYLVPTPGAGGSP